MKKIILVFALLIAIISNILADSWLSVDYGFQFGYISNGNIQFYQKYELEKYAPFDIVFSLDAKLFNFIKIGGKAIINFSFFNGDSPINFDPTGLSSFFSAGIEPIKGISIIYEHSCNHPIISYLPFEKGKSILDGGYDRIYFEIKGKVDF